MGSGFRRIPSDSTTRYTAWANRLTSQQLLTQVPSTATASFFICWNYFFSYTIIVLFIEILTQVYTSHGPTVIMPTWFCDRRLYDNIGGFTEAGRFEPEDLIFFYQHLRAGGSVLRAPGELLVYRYHAGAATFSISELELGMHIEINNAMFCCM